jgi:hypothetical protein
MTRAIVVGGGPAGLMAAEALAERGIQVDLYDTMPSVGRKFLLAGKGGLNLTHSEPLERFLDRFGPARGRLEPMVRAFGPDRLREWAAGLGVETFVGTSGRVFPAEMKAAPLLRAWLRRLKAGGVAIHVRHRFLGWDGEDLRFAAPSGEVRAAAPAVVLALGGASWPQLGSDGAWADLLAARGIESAPLKPANCGFEVEGGWSEVFRSRFAGKPLKPIAIHGRKGEAMVTDWGIEGGLVYAFAAEIRDGGLAVELDLCPDRTEEALAQALSKPRGSRTLSDHLERQTGLKAATAGLLREVGPLPPDAAGLARLIKRFPLKLSGPRPLEEAISTAGGVRLDQMDAALMARPGLFLAGEMLDWEAPTGGYLLTACLATGRWAGMGAAQWLGSVTKES